MLVYVASSWKNLLQPGIVRALRSMGHQAYDFRNPHPGNTAFRWSDIDPNYEKWTTVEWRKALKHPLAVQGFNHDMNALEQCDACVLVLPAGRSSCFEFGYAMATGKKCVLLAMGEERPDLMFARAEICADMNEFFDAFDFERTLPIPGTEPKP